MRTMIGKQDGRTILITGGAGFVGSSVGSHLKRTMPGVRILALDNLKRRGSELNLSSLREASVDFVHGDVRRIISDSLNWLKQHEKELRVRLGSGPVERSKHA